MCRRRSFHQIERVLVLLENAATDNDLAVVVDDMDDTIVAGRLRFRWVAIHAPS
jgi:hypothetical protein